MENLKIFTSAVGRISVATPFSRSGGSRSHPLVCPGGCQPVTLEISDIPRESLDAERDLDWVLVSTSGAPRSRREVLQAELAHYLSQIATIVHACMVVEDADSYRAAGPAFDIQYPDPTPMLDCLADVMVELADVANICFLPPATLGVWLTVAPSLRIRSANMR